MNAIIERQLAAMTDQEKARLAAEILNDTVADLDTLETFFNTLEDGVHGEVVGRAAAEEDRD